MAIKNSKEISRIIEKGGSNSEPSIDMNNYNHSLSQSLNYYNESWTLADYKSSAIEYATSIGIKISAIIPEYHFRGIGAVARLILRDCTLRADDISRVIDKLHSIQNEYEKSKVPDGIIIDTPIIKEVDFLVIDFLNNIEDVLIQSILDGSKPTIDSYVSEYVSKEYTKTQAKFVMAFINSKLEYYTSVYNDIKGSDADFKDAWSHVPSTRIKTAYKSLELLGMGISAVQLKEKVLTIKTKKVVSPLIQSKDIPYQSEYENIKGVHPSNVVGCSEIWVYDTDTRGIHVMRSIKDEKFQAKGFTFLNIDVDRSFKKTLRKIEDLYLFTNTLEVSTKKSLLNTFNTIKTTQQQTNGRMSKSKIIIHTFK